VRTITTARGCCGTKLFCTSYAACTFDYQGREVAMSVTTPNIGGVDNSRAINYTFTSKNELHDASDTFEFYSWAKKDSSSAKYAPRAYQAARAYILMKVKRR